MNITFLVGNGFDLGLGLHTSYCDFYKWYCSQDDASEYIQRFKKNIEDDLTNGSKFWSDFEIGLGEYSNSFSAETYNQYIACIEDARRKLVEYLDDETKNFQLTNTSDEAIQSFREGVKNFYQELSRAEKAELDHIFQEDIMHDCEIKFISFNYTNVLDKCVSVLAQDPPLKTWNPGNGNRSFKVNPDVIHVHGQLEQYPIMGVNDKTQVKNQEVLKNNVDTAIIKPLCNQALGELWQETALTQINNSRIICIFGLSLGPTDAIWWEKITLWLKDNQNRLLIIYWHTGEIIDQINIYNRIQKISEVQHKILGFANLEETEIDGLSKRIHVIFNTEKVLRINMNNKNTQ